ncbi:hypothetical protein GXW82_32945 [Streptacidiphilus sp. 4-A2]|nr:hypothetical protein [Streptacidiphilus sp. 4-A2]
MAVWHGLPLFVLLAAPGHWGSMVRALATPGHGGRGTPMGLGPRFRHTLPDAHTHDVNMRKNLAGEPAIPVQRFGLVDADDMSPSDATRLLCAVAHLRFPWRSWFDERRAVMVDALIALVRPKRFRAWLQRRRKEAQERRAGNGAEERLRKPDKQYSVVIGSDYARWVRRRVLGSRWLVPSHGFDLAEVALSCGQATRLARRRRLLTTAAVAVATVDVLWTGSGWGLLIAVMGSWLARYADRVSSQRLLRQVLTKAGGELSLDGSQSQRDRETVARIRSQAGSAVMPYEQQIRSGTVRYHFLGAGKVWFEQSIGIDVMSAVPRDHRTADDEEPSWLKTDFSRILSGRDADDGVKPFTPDDLLDHVMHDLDRLAAPNRDFHPDNRQDVFSVVAVAADHWPGITPSSGRSW